MSLRFAALLTAVAGLLGVMVTVVAGHIVAARKDWAVYQSLPEATVSDVSVWTVIGTEPLTYAYLTALLLVLGTVVLLCASWGASNRRRFMVNRMFVHRQYSSGRSSETGTIQNINNRNL